MTHTLSIASKLTVSLAVAFGLALSAPVAHAWSDAGVGYCPTAALRPGPGTLPADFSHLLADEWLGVGALSAVRVDEDGTTHFVELRTETRGTGTLTHNIVSIVGGWTEGERYRFSATSSGCPDVEYLIGPPLGAPLTLGTLRATEASWTLAGQAVSEVTLDLAPEAHAFIGLYDVELRVDEARIALGALGEMTGTIVSIACGGGGPFEEGDHALSFHAGPPGEATTVSTPVHTATLTCPSEPPPLLADGGEPEGGAPDGGASDAPPAAAQCSVGAPGLGGSGYGMFLALAIALGLRRKPT